MKFEHLSEKNKLRIWFFLQYFICPFVGHKQDEWSDDCCARCFTAVVWPEVENNG